ncbi:MAG: flagellar export chaperone FliS [Burkholderiales bacterium]|nr:flagellar export chaperone FliS [Burkholderiales bacterium]
MYGQAQRALNAYARVGVETGVEAADPHKLVLMLFEGAMIAVNDARRHLAGGEIAARGSAISKAILIIENGLKASLDMKAGGELAQHLADLYDYMRNQLLAANLHASLKPLEEVHRLLGDLKDAWAQVGDKRTAVSRSAGIRGAA